MVSIYVVHYNKPNLVSLQFNKLKDYLFEDFKYFAVNNGINQEIKNEISNIVKSLGITEISISNNNRIPNTAMHHKEALQYVYDNYINNDQRSIRIVMDCDIIPFRKFTFSEILGDNDIAGIQMGIRPSLYIASFISIYSQQVKFDDFNLGADIEFDSGVPTGNIVKNHKTKWLLHTAPMKEKEGQYIFKNKSEETLNYDSTFYIQFIESCLLHFYRGTGWDNGDINYAERKLDFILSFLNNVNEYKPLLDENVQYESAHMDEWINKENYPLYKIIK
jgi:hypothetical protein